MRGGTLASSAPMLCLRVAMRRCAPMKRSRHSYSLAFGSAAAGARATVVGFGATSPEEAGRASITTPSTFFCCFGTWLRSSV